MRLYIVQHGEAVSKEEDPDRPLSKQGRSDIQRLGQFLKQAGVQAERVLHSGKTRARQTAEILANSMTTHNAVNEHRGLGPNDAVEPLVQEINKWNRHTVIAGHLPFVARLVAALVTGTNTNAIVGYQPGALVCLERNDSGEWTVAWMLRPELLTTET